MLKTKNDNSHTPGAENGRRLPALLSALLHACIIAGALLPLSAHAVEPCDWMDDEAERLECERVMAPPHWEIQSGDDPEAPWRVTTDPIPDDTRNIYMYVLSEERIPDPLGGESKRAALYIRCMNDTTNVWINVNSMIADSAGYAMASLQIDDGEPFSPRFPVTTDFEGFGQVSGPAIRFAKRLFGGDMLIAEIALIDQTVNLSFPIKGLEASIKPLRQACHW